MAVPAVIETGLQVGNDAGWALAFYSDETAPPGGPSQTRAIGPRPKLLLSRDDYYAEIAAVLPGDFAPGRYTFVIEGLIDEHYAQIAVDDVVRLYLFWRDTSSAPGGPPNLAGMVDRLTDLTVEQLQDFLVAELVVTSVSRRAGARRYETTIEARERVFMRLRGPGLPDALATSTFADAANKLVDGLDISVDLYGFTPSGLVAGTPSAHPGDEKMPLDPEKTRARAMADLGKALEQAHKDRRGRGMLLIRRGTLLVGPRDIPLGPVLDLSYRNGLIESVLDKPQAEPTLDDPVAPPEPGKPQYRLTLKGRPDILPGDVVRFRPAPEDDRQTTPDDPLAGLTSALGPLEADESREPQVTLYVNAVEHRLGRKSAFATSIAGVVIRDDTGFSDAWERDPPPSSASEPGATGHRGSTPNAAESAARAVDSRAAREVAARQFADVAEVRVTNGISAGESEPPSQTETVWRGLDGADGRANETRRVAIRRKRPTALEGVPYASPFAWGKCGLVVPRYPGTRVVLVHRNGQALQPVDIGALWESAQGPDTLAGDWWLILPAGIDDDKREKASGETQPKPWFKEVTNDLIDADGNRVIHVGELTIRVGKLTLAGDRPDRAPLKEGVTIEHAAGDARITIDKDGKIRVEANGDLELVSKQGDIALQAPQGSVNVSVADSMEVS
jgi:hypothetical protein